MDGVLFVYNIIQVDKIISEWMGYCLFFESIYNNIQVDIINSEWMGYCLFYEYIHMILFRLI